VTAVMSTVRTDAQREQSHCVCVTEDSGVVRAQGLLAPAAEAFGGEIALSDVKYELIECKPNTYIPTGRGFVCAEFTATAQNDLRCGIPAGAGVAPPPSLYVYHVRLYAEYDDGVYA
jgi:hypothetical protein